MRSATRTITIAASVERVFAYLADATNLPHWAPSFTSGVRAEGEDWIAIQGDAELGLRIAADSTAHTVDLHVTAPNGRRVVIYMRVLPNESGAEFVFTLFHSNSRTDEQIADGNAEVEAELGRVKEFCEAD
jgi:uncharacterized protein YndB with AHSA1/START domain